MRSPHRSRTAAGALAPRWRRRAAAAAATLALALPALAPARELDALLRLPLESLLQLRVAPRPAAASAQPPPLRRAAPGAAS